MLPEAGRAHTKMLHSDCEQRRLAERDMAVTDMAEWVACRRWTWAVEYSFGHSASFRVAVLRHSASVCDRGPDILGVLPRSSAYPHTAGSAMMEQQMRGQ